MDKQLWLLSGLWVRSGGADRSQAQDPMKESDMATEMHATQKRFVVKVSRSRGGLAHCGGRWRFPEDMGLEPWSYKGIGSTRRNEVVGEGPIDGETPRPLLQWPRTPCTPCSECQLPLQLLSGALGRVGQTAWSGGRGRGLWHSKN